jgi:hypothetical protein
MPAWRTGYQACVSVFVAWCYRSAFSSTENSPLANAVVRNTGLRSVRQAELHSVPVVQKFECIGEFHDRLQFRFTQGSPSLAP